MEISEEDFSNKVNLLRPWLLKVFIFRWNLGQEAEDFTQDVHLMLLRRFRRGFRPNDDNHLRANVWLAAKTVAFNFFKSRKITTSESKNGNHKSCKGIINKFASVPLKEFHGMSEIESSLVAACTVAELMANLTNAQRSAIQSCTLEGESSFDFAIRSGIPRTSITGRIDAAMKAMKKTAKGAANFERMAIARRGWETRNHI